MKLNLLNTDALSSHPNFLLLPDKYKRKRVSRIRGTKIGQWQICRKIQSIMIYHLKSKHKDTIN